MWGCTLSAGCLLLIEDRSQKFLLKVFQILVKTSRLGDKKRKGEKCLLAATTIILSLPKPCGMILLHWKQTYLVTTKKRAHFAITNLLIDSSLFFRNFRIVFGNKISFFTLTQKGRLSIGDKTHSAKNETWKFLNSLKLFSSTTATS